jgi:predicted XRE-type DNA-binding protein
MKTKVMSEKKNKPSHISKGNVLDDLGFSPEEAAALKLKVDLHSEILKAVEKRKLSARELEKILDQPQPRISELMTGKISRMSAERLTGYLSLLGVAVKISSSYHSKKARELRAG